jgi:branched-chain amino acid transport system substrate-binding protein
VANSNLKRRSGTIAVAVGLVLALSAALSAQAFGEAATKQVDRATVRAAAQTPIVIAEVGDFSSVIGSALAPSRDALQAWVKMINKQGGLDGHPVKLLVGDDGGDSAKSLELAKDFVEHQGAVALVNYVGSAVSTIAAYAEKQKVPVIGGLPDQTWFESWATFPTQPPQSAYGYAQAKIAADLKLRKAAALYCSEAPLCHDVEKGFVGNAPKVKVDVVYEAAISIVQPDFTAECLKAKDEGAKMLLAVTDGNSITRLAESCDRQNYQPTFFNLSPTTEQASQSELDGMVAVLRDFPWFLTSGNPALVEYGKATAGQKRQFQTAIGWSAAKLLQRAAQHLSATPTSDDLFDGLWSLQNETLGGLVAPLTFTKMQPPTPGNCAFLAKVKSGKWTAPDGVELQGCMPKS